MSLCSGLYSKQFGQTFYCKDHAEKAKALNLPLNTILRKNVVVKTAIKFSIEKRTRLTSKRTALINNC